MAGQSGNKNRKYGRTLRKGHSARYKNENRRNRNKVRKLQRHLKAFPDDAQAKESLDRVAKGLPGVPPIPAWTRKYKYDVLGDKGNQSFMYRERIPRK